ncbi:TIGR03089 family protein [Tessaracoccus lubricantis]|uniref:TIGR03089 family protein n=1 Tax=Tessaracoccus lubricantis TaxID=545543 RepID=A0ABP9FDE4_9ACTN
MLISALHKRVSRLGAQPLITYYDGEEGSRIELSAVTFANWVDKTANLIADLGHDDGEPIDIALASSHPGHWVTLVWIAAAWQRGCAVNPDVTGADLLVVGPGDDRRAETTVACSLHPLGLGFPTPPANAVDYREVFGQPDLHDMAVGGESYEWDGAAAPAVMGRDDRVLLRDPAPGWETVARALVEPVLGTGSTVVVVRTSDEGVGRISAGERVAH